MWANAQRDGRPAYYRWRPLFNAAVWLTPTIRVPCSNCRVVYEDSVNRRTLLVDSKHGHSSLSPLHSDQVLVVRRDAQIAQRREVIRARSNDVSDVVNHEAR